jgi:hypothetical protein
MTITQKIEYLWNKAYTDALGAGEADPYAYADAKVAYLVARLHRVERAQSGVRFQRGSRAGRRQFNARQGG